jgi:hypothetical protein
MKIKEYNDMKAYLLKPNRLFTSKPQDTIGGGAIQGEDLGSRTGFGSPEAIEYLKNLKPGSAVNTYAIGKQFGIAPATVRGQVERNFPQLTLQTREEAAAGAMEKEENSIDRKNLMFLFQKLELEVKVQSLELKVEMLQMLDGQVKK